MTSTGPDGGVGAGSPEDAAGSPAVVALGGGHGLAAALRALRRFAEPVTAVVSAADDGGSSGRLRRELGVLPPGDIRKCLVALAEDGNVWAEALEFRFGDGEPDGHALGNLLLAGLSGTTADFAAAVSEVGRLVGAVGTVVPATTEPVVLKADVDGRAVEGQVAVSRSEGRIGRVAIVPEDAPAPERALEAIAGADLVVLAPGSLYTSLLPVVCVGELRDALVGAPGRVVQVCNLASQVPETEGLSGVDHLRGVFDHGARVDTFLYDRSSPLAVDEDEVRALGVEPVAADVAERRGSGGRAHDPVALGAALAALTRSRRPG